MADDVAGAAPVSQTGNTSPTARLQAAQAAQAAAADSDEGSVYLTDDEESIDSENAAASGTALAIDASPAACMLDVMTSSKSTRVARRAAGSGFAYAAELAKDMQPLAPGIVRKAKLEAPIKCKFRMGLSGNDVNHPGLEDVKTTDDARALVGQAIGVPPYRIEMSHGDQVLQSRDQPGEVNLILVQPELDLDQLWLRAERWVQQHSNRSQRGAIQSIWRNESIFSEGCPARQNFLRAIGMNCVSPQAVWEGRFGWLPVSSLQHLNDVCWDLVPPDQSLDETSYHLALGDNLDWSQRYNQGRPTAQLSMVFWTSHAHSRLRQMCFHSTDDREITVHSEDLCNCICVAVVAFGTNPVAKPEFRCS